MSATRFPTVADNPAATFAGFYPLGFKNEMAFKEFIIDLYMDMPVFDGVIVFQGSSVAGESYASKSADRAFDAGRVSDYDISICSATLFERAQADASIKFKPGHKTYSHELTHTQPLTDPQLAFLRLGTMKANAAARITNYSTRDREVNFMLYKTVAMACDHTGPSLVCPEPRVLNMGTWQETVALAQMQTEICGEKKFRRY